MTEFTAENIERLFGAEDAENETEDRFKEYFFYSGAYNNITSTVPIRILVGHKGVGKSALLKRAYLADIDKNSVALWLRPGDFTNFSSPESTSDFNQHIERVKNDILSLITRKLLGSIGDNISDSELSYKKTSVKLVDAIVTKLQQSSSRFGIVLDEVLANIFLKSKTVHVYIDDIDRGWSASVADIRNISALLNAIRDISGSDHRIRFRIGLRSDVYFLVRTSDESTDKLERHLVWLEWSLHDILCIIAKRIETFFSGGRDQQEILQLSQEEISIDILSKVIDPVFIGRGHWASRPIHNVLLSLTRKRPRDLVKLMQSAAKRAYKEKHERISSRDLEAAFQSYSNERLQDIINEFKSELPLIEQLLLNMKPTKKERKASMSYLFTSDELSRKISNVLRSVPVRFTNNRPVNGRSVIQFLYKIDFITARKDHEGAIERTYFDNARFLANEFTDFGYDWEIHPAYRWALQPQDLQDVFDSIGR